MADLKPLVIAPDPSNQDGSVILQQLRPGVDLDIPLADRVVALESRLTLLVHYLAAIGLEVPEELL